MKNFLSKIFKKRALPEPKAAQPETQAPSENKPALPRVGNPC
jgi:hypothetical protein